MHFICFSPRHERCGETGFLVDGLCYMLGYSSSLINYDESRLACRQRGGHLASFHSKEQVYKIKAVVWPQYRAFPIWVGGRVGGDSNL